MNAPGGQSLAEADLDVRAFLVRIAGTLGDALGDALCGLYVYGSLATGAYHRERSDIDLIAVSAGELSAREREALARTLLRLSDSRPTRGDIEISVVAQQHARNFSHPVPCEIRYNRGLHEAIRRRRIDYSGTVAGVDLAAPVIELRERGVALVGPPASALFGPVPWHAYMGALQADFECARERASSDPVYAVLGACRVLHGATDRRMTPLNKDEAASWALANVPHEHQSVINDALQLYRGTKTADDVVFNGAQIAALREYVRGRAQPAFDRACGSDEE